MTWGQGGRPGRVDNPARRSAWEDRAASEVVGTIILVSITVVMAGGFAVLLGNFSQPVDLAHADLDVSVNAGEDGSWNTGEEEIVVRHMGGENLEGDATTVRLQIGPAVEELQGSDIGGVFADRFVIGETLILTRTIALGTTVDIIVTYSQGGSSIVAAHTVNPGGVTVPGGEIFAYPTSETRIEGTVANFDELKVPDDDVVATYTEESVTGPSGDTLTPSLAAGSGATNPGNALISDEAHAVLASSGNYVEVSSWDPEQSGTIDTVTAKVEWKYTGNPGTPGGADTIQLSDQQAPGTTYNLPPPSSADRVDSVQLDPPGGSWEWTEITAMVLRAQYLAVGAEDNRDFAIDAIWIELSLTPASEYSLEVRLEFAGVTSGNDYQVQVRYSTELDSYRIQVQNPGVGTWSACADLVASATLTSLDGCSLTVDQYNSGDPVLRVVDVTGSTTDQGKVHFDHVRIRVT